MDADAARMMARAECLKAAVAFRTPGTSPEALIFIAARLWEWVAADDAALKTSDTPRAKRGPDDGAESGARGRR